MSYEETHGDKRIRSRVPPASSNPLPEIAATTQPLGRQKNKNPHEPRRKRPSSFPYEHSWIVEGSAAYRYLSTQFSIHDRLDNILVLHASREETTATVQCTTLKALLLSVTDSDSLVEALLHSFWALMQDGEPQHIETENFVLDLQYDRVDLPPKSTFKQRVWVDAWAASSAIFQTLDKILSLLIASLRHFHYQESPIVSHEEGALYWSEAKIQTSTSETTTTIKLSPPESLKHTGCWAAVFAMKVVVASRSDPESSNSFLQPDLHMLEAPLPWLAELAGVDTPLYLPYGLDGEGGLCLSGLYSLLIPTRAMLSASGARILIWHLIMQGRKQDQAPRSRRELMQAAACWATENEFFLVNTVEELIEPDIHMLGWTTQAKIRLATRDQSYVLKRTNALTVTQEVGECTINFGLGLGYGGPGTTIGGSFKIGKGERTSLMDKDAQLEELLLWSDTAQVCLWNPVKLQAWVVPQILVILHLTIAYLRDQSPRLGGWADLTWRLQELYDPPNALQVILANLNIRTAPKSEQRLKDVVKSMLLMLDQMHVSNIPVGNSRQFRGFEAYDLLYQPKYYRLKQDDASVHPWAMGSRAGWHRILPEMAAVLFSSDLADLIVSEQDPDDTDSGFDTMPESSGYLAITVPSLMQLLSRHSFGNGGLLSDNGHPAWWQCQYLFGHRVDRSMPRENCDKLQVMASKPDPTGIPIRRLQEALQGAMVFRPNTGILERAKGEVYGVKSSTARPAINRKPVLRDLQQGLDPFRTVPRFAHNEWQDPRAGDVAHTDFSHNISEATAYMDSLGFEENKNCSRTEAGRKKGKHRVDCH